MPPKRKNAVSTRALAKRANTTVSTPNIASAFSAVRATADVTDIDVDVIITDATSSSASVADDAPPLRATVVVPDQDNLLPATVDARDLVTKPNPNDVDCWYLMKVHVNPRWKDYAYCCVKNCEKPWKKCQNRSYNNFNLHVRDKHSDELLKAKTAAIKRNANGKIINFIKHHVNISESNRLLCQTIAKKLLFQKQCDVLVMN